jgi:hypothetical protein
MQASFSGSQRRMRALPRTLHMESGIAGKSRLLAANDHSFVSDDFFLAFLFYGIFYTLKKFVVEIRKIQPAKHAKQTKKDKKYSNISYFSRSLACLAG